MANNRIFYAIQAVKVKPCQLSGTTWNYGTEVVLRGIQSVGINTSFKLEQVYQLGQLSLYDNVENVPDIEVTLNKVLDGTRTVYNTALDGTSAGSSDGLTLTQISDRRCDLALGIWNDTSASTSGSASYFVTCTGMYVSNVSYKLVTDGNFTEDVTLVGNHKKWGGAGGITSFSDGIETSETRTVARRWNLNTTDSVLPTGPSGGIPGSFASGTLHVESATVTCNLGRDAINELGRRAPYYRYIKFPVEVTSEFEVVATQGDNVDADDFSTQINCASATHNLASKTIKLVICADTANDGTVTADAYTFDLGAKNKLTSVNYKGGDTGGANVTVTYSYQTFNEFKVSSPS